MNRSSLSVRLSVRNEEVWYGWILQGFLAEIQMFYHVLHKSPDSLRIIEESTFDFGLDTLHGSFAE
jgi:hypothetical protein